MTKRSTLLTFLLVSLANVVWGQLPSATLEPSGATAFCQSGIAKFRIKLNGSAPFSYSYKTIRISDGKLISASTNPGPIYEDVFIDGYYYPNGNSISEGVTFELVEVFDKNVPIPTGYQYIGGTPLGSTNVSGTATFQIDQMPVTNAGPDQSNVCGYSTSLAAAPQFADSEIFWDIPSIGSLSATNSAAPTFTAPYEGSFILTFNEN